MVHKDYIVIIRKLKSIEYIITYNDKSDDYIEKLELGYGYLIVVKSLIS